MNVLVNEIKNYVCPVCKSHLIYNSRKLECNGCKKHFKIYEGIPDFFIESETNEHTPAIKSVQFIDHLAKFYESMIWYPLVYHLYGGIRIPKIKDTVRMITEMIDPKERTVLDVACGTGIYTRSIAKQAEFVYGIDISQGMLEKAKLLSSKENIRNIKYCKANVEKLPFPNDYFDAASCSGALHLFQDTIKALEEIARVLKTDSPFSVMTFTRRRFLKYRFVYEHIKKDHGAIIFDLQELGKMLELAGFKEFKPIVYGSMLLFSTIKK